MYCVASKAPLARLVASWVLRLIARRKYLCLVRSKVIVVYDLGVAAVKVTVSSFAVVVGARGRNTCNQVFSVVLVKGRYTYLTRQIWLSKRRGGPPSFLSCVNLLIARFSVWPVNIRAIQQ